MTRSAAGPELPHVLVVDDDPGVRYTLIEVLSSEGVDAQAVRDGQEAWDLLQKERFELVLADLRMPRMDGLALLRATRTLSPPPRFVLLTAHGSERTAVEAIQGGAFDYFRKPFDVDELLGAVRRALETVRLARDNERLQGVAHLSRSLVFRSPAMERLAMLVARVAPRDVNVLLRGESGTGKERVAEAIVAGSARKDKPYVRFNCAALTADLAEAELFGHSKGAFTGAQRARPGMFREADGGTLLLDEVGELDPLTQGKLLRVLQEGEVRPVGEERSVRVDVRVLAATHRDLRERVAAGTFREDLFWRLHVVEIVVPPLRERKEDIALLARHFAERYARRFGVPGVHVSDALMSRLTVHDWPGNVRELEHAIERLVALSPEGELDEALLELSTTGGGEGLLDLKSRMEAYERGIILEALDAARGNRSEAARQLGIGRVTLHDKLRKYGVFDASR